MALDFKVEGLRELDRKLRRLEEAAAVKALRAALQKQARPIVRDAKARANAGSIRDSGALAASIGTFSRRGRGDMGGRITVSIGPKKRAKRAIALYLSRHPTRSDDDPKLQSGQVIRHGHLVEFGAGSTPARPFLRPAFDANVDNVINGFASDLAASIAKVAAQ